MGLFDRFLARDARHGAAGGTPLRDAVYTVIDTELTGLDERKDSIVSVGAVRVRDGRIMLGESFYSAVSPTSELTGRSVVVHGLTPSDLAGKPKPGDALTELASFCGGDILVGHCVSIDTAFIKMGLAGAGLPMMGNRAVDTLAIHCWLRDNDQRYSRTAPAINQGGLYAIARALGIPVTGAHNALMDAFITAQVFQAFIPVLEKAGISETGGLLQVAGPVRGGEGYFSPDTACGL